MSQILNHPDWEFAGIFYDFGKSGLREKGRTGLEKMLKQAEAGAVAQEESRDMSENMQWTVTRNFEQGIFANYKAFMGYRCVNGELEIVPEQAEVVKQIFNLYLAGNTFAQIKRELEEQKIKTATGKESWDVKCGIYPTLYRKVVDCKTFYFTFLE